MGPKNAKFQDIDSIYVARDRMQWGTLLNSIIDRMVPVEGGHFGDKLRDYQWLFIMGLTYAARLLSGQSELAYR